MTMENGTDIGHLVARVAPHVAYPPTPQLRARVVARLDGAARGGVLSDTTAWPRVAFAALVIAALAAAASLAVPSSRAALARFFGIRGEHIERLPTLAPGTTATPLPTPSDITAFATPVAFADARFSTGFTPALPADGAPDATYVVNYGERVVVLQYARYDLWQSHSVGFFDKGLPASAVLDELTVKGAPAAWIAGAGHIVTYVAPDGTPVAGSQRTVARNTLVWATSAANYRIETDLSEAEAIAIAETLP